MKTNFNVDFMKLNFRWKVNKKEEESSTNAFLSSKKSLSALGKGSQAKQHRNIK